MDNLNLTTHSRFVLHFGLSLIGGLLGCWLGSYGDIVLNVDTQIVGLVFGAIAGGWLLGHTTQGQLMRAVITAVAAGVPAFYLVTQNQAIVLVAVAVVLLAGLGSLSVSGLVTLTKTLRRRAA